MTSITPTIVKMRRQRAAVHLHQLGARSVLEALIEVAETGDLDRTLEAFGRLDIGLVQQIGGDRFPPSPLYVVGGAGNE